MFKVGDKVVRKTPNQLLVVGGVYTVDWMSSNTRLTLKETGNYSFHPKNFKLAKVAKKVMKDINKPTPHKHAAIIKAWADGAEIEGKTTNGNWITLVNPKWAIATQYRVKPEKKPDVVHFAKLEVSMNTSHQALCKQEDSNFKVTFDGETGKLIKVELI